MAASKSITVSSTQSGIKENAVDGNPITVWESNFNDNQWFYVDLGKAFTVNKVYVDWGDQASEKYLIKYKRFQADPWTEIIEQTGVTNDQEVYTAFSPVEARFIKVYSTRRTNNDWSIKVQQFMVFGTGRVDVAAKRVVTVSSTQSGYKDHAVDEIPATLWESNFNDNQWIYVDLGQSYQVSKVFIDWGDQASEKYLIRYKLNDADPWINIVEQTGVSDHQEVYTSFSAVKARYIKIYSTKRTNNDWGIKVQSLMVFGMGNQNKDLCYKIKSRKDNRYLKQLEPGKEIVASGITPNEGDAFCLSPVLGKFKIFKNGTVDYWKRQGSNEDRILAVGTIATASAFYRQPCFYSGQTNRFGFMDPEDEATQFLKAHDIGQTIATYNSAACDMYMDANWEAFFLEYVGEANYPPQIANVSPNGDFRVGSQLTCNYTYSDADGDVEGATRFQWFSSIDTSGNSKIKLPGAVGKTYQINQSDMNRYLSCEVEPFSTTGISPGKIVSNPTPYPGPVLETDPGPIPDFLQWKFSKYIRFNTESSGADIVQDVPYIPILIKLNPGNFDFTQANHAGDDIRFEYAGKPLKYEFETWDFKNKSAEIWLLMPIVKAKSNNQKVRMLWGNPTATRVSSSQDVFSANNSFAGVWHLGETGNTQVGGFKDATANQNNGTGWGFNSSSTIKGIAGFGQKFDGTTSFINAGHGNSLDIGGSTDRLTFSAWVNFSAESLKPQYATLMSKGDHSYHMHHLGDEGSVSSVVYDGAWRQSISSVPILENKWYYLAGTFDGSEVVLYVNGKRQDSCSLSGFLPSDLDFNIGRNSEYCSRYFKGTLDEVTVSNAARSSDWVKLSYENQRDGQQFVVVPENPKPERVEDDLLVLHDFKSDTGNAVLDISGTSSLVDMAIQAPASVEWFKGGGLDVKGASLITSQANATEVIDAIRGAGEFSVELWIDPLNTVQGVQQRAQILTLSDGTGSRDLTLSQIGSGIQAALRTTETDETGGIPSFLEENALTGELAHLVFTFATDGTATLYLNGEEIESARRHIPGTLANWTDFKLSLANEPGTKTNPWLGTYYMMGIYRKALSLLEVRQNFNAGALGTVSFAQRVLNRTAMNYDMALLENFKLTAGDRSVYISEADVSKLRIDSPFLFFAGKSRTVVGEDAVFGGMGDIASPYMDIAATMTNNPKEQLLRCRHAEFAGEEILEGSPVYRIKADRFAMPWNVIGLFPEPALAGTDAVTFWIDKSDYLIRKFEFRYDDTGGESPYPSNSIPNPVGFETYSIGYGACLSGNQTPNPGGYRFWKFEVGNPLHTEKGIELTEVELLAGSQSLPAGDMTSNTSLSPVVLLNKNTFGSFGYSDVNTSGWQLFDGDIVNYAYAFPGGKRFPLGLILDLGPGNAVLPQKIRLSINEKTGTAPVAFRLFASQDSVHWVEAAAANNIQWAQNEAKEWPLDFNALGSACIPAQVRITNQEAIAKMSASERILLQTRRFLPGQYVDTDAKARFAQLQAQLPKGTDTEKIFAAYLEDRFKTEIETSAGLRYRVKDAFVNAAGPLIIDFTLTGDRTQQHSTFFE